jgi:hypothetical protein
VTDRFIKITTTLAVVVCVPPSRTASSAEPCRRRIPSGRRERLATADAIPSPDQSSTGYDGLAPQERFAAYRAVCDLHVLLGRSQST